MSYAIISVGGKQYRVREGERLLVDRLTSDEGTRFTPRVLLAGGDGEAQLAPDDVTVTARVVSQQRGPKIRIGKYRQRTGYRRHTGFRAALTQIEIESIGAGKPRSAAARPSTGAKRPSKAPGAPGKLPEAYAEMTVPEIKEAVGSWTTGQIRAALEHEQGQRKGAMAALEAALAEKEGGG